MRPIHSKTVLFMILSCLPGIAKAQTFNGPYAGLEVGRQQIIGGSVVDGVDTLQDDSRPVITGLGGLRLQRLGWVIGGELGISKTDGRLRLSEPGIEIDYVNGSQWHWGLHAGRVIGANTLLVAYVSEVTRQFDVTITRPSGRTQQQDEQGLLRFGGALEVEVRGPLHARVSIGTSRADFGDRTLNRTPGRRLDAGAALILHF